MTRKAKPADFERSLQELETLVDALEQGDLPLEEAMKRFERGVALTRDCQAALKSAQARVEILVNQAGESRLEPFAEEPETDVDADEEEQNR